MTIEPSSIASREEFRTAAQFEHPNILRLIDFGQDSGFWYLVSEWVEGITLAHMVEAHTRLPEETAVRILTQIGQAVDYAHTVGYAHCRVRPANVLIRNDGVAKLMAFRPAMRCMDAKGERGQAGRIRSMQTICRSPRTFPLPCASSLGATLYEAATGLAWISTRAHPRR